MFPLFICDGIGGSVRHQKVILTKADCASSTVRKVSLLSALVCLTFNKEEVNSTKLTASRRFAASSRSA